MNRLGKHTLFVPLFLLCASLCCGAPPCLAQPFGLGSGGRQPSQQQVLCSGCARFVFGQISESGKDQFMLDTATGRLWRMSESGKAGDFLRPVMYRVGDDEYAAVPGESERPCSKKPKKQ